MTEGLNFEQALQELETVVKELQRPEIPLGQAVALYRRGTELAQKSEELLGAAELQVQKLTDAVQERFAEYSVGAPEDDQDF
jgi:exodeoxyribonuclease VII small subunit